MFLIINFKEMSSPPIIDSIFNFYLYSKEEKIESLNIYVKNMLEFYDEKAYENIRRRKRIIQKCEIEIIQCIKETKQFYNANKDEYISKIGLIFVTDMIEMCQIYDDKLISLMIWRSFS